MGGYAVARREPYHNRLLAVAAFVMISVDSPKKFVATML